MENENVVSDQLENSSAEIKNDSGVGYDTFQRTLGQKKAFQKIPLLPTEMISHNLLLLLNRN